MKDSEISETDIDIVQKKAVDAMIAINAAIRTLHLYPLSSAVCSNSIDKAYGLFLTVLEQTEELIFSESEKRLLICGRPLNEAEMQKPQVSAFLDLLLNFGIREISVKKGMEKEEFAKFLAMIGTNPGKIREAGGLKKLLAESGFRHVRMDDKVFVSQEKEQKRESGAKQRVEIGQIYGPMVETLDSILDMENKSRVSKCLASSIVKKDEDFLSTVLVQKAEGDLGRQLFHHLIDEMDDKQFEKLVFRFRQMIADKAGAEKNSTEKEVILQAIRNMLKTEKGEHLQTRLREKKSQEQIRKARQSARLRAGIDNILNDRDEAFRDPDLMEFLPGAVNLLFAQKQNAAAEKLIDRMGDGLLSRDPEIRHPVSRALSLIFRQSPQQSRSLLVRRLSYNLSDWVKMETRISPEYESICVCLKNLARAMIKKYRLEECLHIIEALHTVCCGKNPEDGNRLPGRDLLRELASDDVMEVLMAEFMANDTERRRQGGLILTRMGAGAAESLLTLLKESGNRYERARVIKAVSDIGRSALPCLEEQIRQGKPWFYMRNLILLFGKTGDISHLDILLPFLRDRDLRVRRECLNTIFLIGGNRREDIFLSSLPQADDQMKSDMVKFLGRMKSGRAVPLLLEMLNSGALVSSRIRNTLEENICMSLGAIGTAEAVSALQHIADSSVKKRFLGRSSDVHRLKSTAEKALQLMAKAATL
ncbi:MAG: HEAT repeat domain-containing protein [Desulfococcaceae bacterium]